jgi:hypothetical protein
MGRVKWVLTIVQQRNYHFLAKPYYSVKFKRGKVLKVCIVLYNSVITTFPTLHIHEMLRSGHTSPIQNLSKHTKSIKRNGKIKKLICLRRCRTRERVTGINSHAINTTHPFPLFLALYNKIHRR